MDNVLHQVGDENRRAQGPPSKHAIRDARDRFCRDIALNRVTKSMAAMPLGTSVTRAVEVIREQMGNALVLARRGHEDPVIAAMATEGGGDPETFAINLARRLRDAAPFLWRDDVRAMVVKVKLQEHVVSASCMQRPVMFWCYQNAIQLRGSNGACMEWCDSLLLSDVRQPDGRGGINILMLGCNEQRGLPVFGTSHIPYGAVWKADKQSDLCTQVLKMCAFLNSPYTETVKDRLPRQMRRGMKRAGAGSERGEISIVVLRRKNEGGSSGSSWKRLFTHRWVVSGHFRAQWYPSDKTHRVIWIPPYVKGPEGKAFKTKVYDVRR